MQEESDEEGDPAPAPAPAPAPGAAPAPASASVPAPAPGAAPAPASALATRNRVPAVTSAAQMILSLAEIYLLLSPASFPGETSAALAVVSLIRAALHLASSVQEVHKDI